MAKLIVRLALFGLLAVGPWAGSGTASAEDLETISIGTASRSGVYYPTGNAICRLVNRSKNEAGIRCSVESTGGSIFNIMALRSGDLEFGIAQSDWQFHAYDGTSRFAEEGPFEALRSVFSIHPEQVTVLARKDANISNLSDLKGKRVNIGNAGSGERATWEVLEGALGWTNEDLTLASDLKASETAQALCDNKIDAYFWLAGHPSPLTQETIARCDAVLVNVAGEAIDALLAEHPYYRATVIPAGMYPGQTGDIESFGVSATLLTTAVVPDDVVYTLVKAVFGNFNDFKNFYPAFAHLTEQEMITEGLTAPLHPGAVRYYKERGWM